MDTSADFNASYPPIQLKQPNDAVHRIIAQLADVKAPNIGLSAAVVISILLGAHVLQYAISAARKPRLPIINKEPWDPWGDKAKTNYLNHARQLIQDGFKKFGGPFYLRMEVDKTIVLPPDYIDAVNKEKGLDFIAFTKTHFLGQYATFENFQCKRAPPEMFTEGIIKGLTRNLPRYTVPLSKEMAEALNDTWGDHVEWREVWLRGDVLKWVTRLSARIFVGDPLAKDPEWLRISEEYTTNLFGAIDKVKAYPRPLWWLTERFHPMARKARADRIKVSELFEPHIKARKEEWDRAAREGRKPDAPDDSIEWFHNASRGCTYSDVDLQVGLFNAAIHTTSDLVGQCILNLCKYPETAQPIRDEAVQVLQKYGWQKIALTEVRLLDSFMKETQRMKPVGSIFMARKAVKDVDLPGGITVRKGQDTVISSHRMWSKDVYGEDADEFNAWRYVMRREQPEYHNNSSFVSTSPDHTGFGHGKHACPGRFFAGNEVKIILMHLILKYDFKFDNVKDADWYEFGVSLITNPAAKIWVRKREPEIDLEAPELLEKEVDTKNDAT